MKETYVKELRILLESEVNEAEIIIAVKGISKSVQDMIEKIGRVTNEDLPPLSEQVRETYGTVIAGHFQTSTNQSLQSVMDALYTAKNDIDSTVQKLVGTGCEIESEIDMDFDIPVGDINDEDPGVEIGLDADPGLDDFGGDPGMSGPLDEPLGRAKKESFLNVKRKLDEMELLLKRAKIVA